MRKMLAFIAVLVGLFASAYLTWSYTSSSHKMVCLDGGCDTVRASQYSHLWGVPIPIYGLLFYALMAGLILAEGKQRQHNPRFWRLLLIFLTGGTAFSAWLTFLEAFVIHAWCEWCVTQAIAVTIACLLTLSIVLWPPRRKTVPVAATEAPPEGEAVRSEAEPASTNLYKSRLAVLVVAFAIGIPALLLLIRHEKSILEQPDPGPQIVTGSQTLVRPDSHQTGAENPLLTIVEFADFQCPSCGVAEKTNRAIRDQYSDRVRFIFRHFPLENIHQFAYQAAKASECAGQQGQFWPMAETLYSNQTELSAPKLKQYAADLHLDTAKFDACLEDPAISTRIRQDMADGAALGIRATPSFFLNGKKVEGGLSFMDVEAALSAARKEKQNAQQPAAPEKPANSAPQPTPTTSTTKASPEKQSKPAPPAQPQMTPTQASQAAAGAGNSTGVSLTPKRSALSASLLAQQAPSSAIVPCGVNDAPVQDPPMIHVEDMKKLLDSKSATVIDVRGSGAYKEAHIPTALNATVDQLEKKIPPELSKAKPVVLYEAGGADESCASSRTAGRILMQNGFKQVRVFKEGLEGWKKQGLPITR